jgi:hypothetical protein
MAGSIDRGYQLVPASNVKKIVKTEIKKDDKFLILQVATSFVDFAPTTKAWVTASRADFWRILAGLNYARWMSANTRRAAVFQPHGRNSPS